MKRTRHGGMAVVAVAWLLAGGQCGVSSDGLDAGSDASSVSGVVQSLGGAPVAGADVRVGPGSATSDDAGYFVITGLAIGTHTVLVSASTYDDWVGEVSLRPGANSLGVIRLLGGCAPGLADCNDDASDGCEAVLESDHANCGACNQPCPEDQECTAGACVPVTCTEPAADCNQKASDGCETDLTVSSESCGSCGHACSAQEICFGGTCVPVLARSDRGLDLVGVDDAWVYWSLPPTWDSLGNLQADGVIARASLDGSTTETLVSGRAAPLERPLMNGSALYWAEPATGATIIRSVAKTGGTVSTLLTFSQGGYTSMPVMIHVDDVAVFLAAVNFTWQDPNTTPTSTHALLRAPLTAPDAPATLVSFVRPWSNLDFLGADPTRLWVAANPGVVVGKADGAVVEDSRLPYADIEVRSELAVGAASVFYESVMGLPDNRIAVVAEIPADPLAATVYIERPTAPADGVPGLALAADSLLWVAGAPDGMELRRMSLADRSIRTELRSSGAATLVARGNDLYMLVATTEVASAIVKYSLTAL